MKRKLLRQIANEWRSNVWLCVELTIVAVAIWYMVINIYLTYRVAMLPNGYHTENTYVMYKRTTPEFSNPSDTVNLDNRKISQMEYLLKALGELPGVEMVALGSNNMPYNYNFQGYSAKPADNDSIWIFGQGRFATPEMAEVMKWEPLAGATSTQELKNVLERGEMIITRSIGRALIGAEELDDGLEGAKSLIGKTLLPNGGDSYTVGAVVEDMRRGKYEPANYGSILFPMRRNTTDILNLYEIIVRVAPGMRAQFEKAFNDALLNEGLTTEFFYIAEMQYQDDIAIAHHAGVDLENRNNTIVIIFLLVSIFLGLLGTFWFRTSRRTSEIAVRKSFGATRSDIFRRLIGEGVILVAISTIPAAIIDWALGWYIVNLPEELGVLFNPWQFLAVGIVVSFILILLMTVAGVWLPACRAMAIDPATALHNE